MTSLWLRNLVLSCFFIVIFGLLVVGAVNVTLSRSNQIKQAEQAMEKVRRWHTQISLEVPASQKQSWSNLGNEYPLKLLTACTIEETDEDEGGVHK